MGTAVTYCLAVVEVAAGFAVLTARPLPVLPRVLVGPRETPAEPGSSQTAGPPTRAGPAALQVFLS